MAVKAKFYVESVTDRTSQGSTYKAREVRLTPAYGQGNEDWCAATPSGEMRLQIDNEAAAAQFKPGQYVLITFEPVEG